jgi:hypothetical protein
MDVVNPAIVEESTNIPAPTPVVTAPSAKPGTSSKVKLIAITLTTLTGISGAVYGVKSLESFRESRVASQMDTPGPIVQRGQEPDPEEKKEKLPPISPPSGQEGGFRPVELKAPPKGIRLVVASDEVGDPKQEPAELKQTVFQDAIQLPPIGEPAKDTKKEEKKDGGIQLPPLDLPPIGEPAKDTKKEEKKDGGIQLPPLDIPAPKVEASPSKKEAPKELLIDTGKKVDPAPKKEEVMPTLTFPAPKKEEPKAELKMDPIVETKITPIKQEPVQIEPIAPKEKPIVAPLDLKPIEEPKSIPVPAPMSEFKPTRIEPSAVPVPEMRSVTPDPTVSVPAIGAKSPPTPVAPVNPTIPASVSKGTPSIESYDEDLHQLSFNDAKDEKTRREAFRGICRKYFEDEGFADALYLYNRENPTGNGYVRVPPIEVLTKKFPNQVPRGSVKTVANSVSPSREEPVVAPVSFANPVRDLPIYTVEGNGETLREIARKQLGNEGYWQALQDLNISVNPNEKIPAGTRLRLPRRGE